MPNLLQTSNNGAPPPAPLNGPSPSPDDERLFRALVSRTGNKAPGRINLTPAEQEAIVTYVINEMQNDDASARQFKENILEMTKNWRGTTEEKDYPWEGAANVRVPFTSVVVEQMKARLLKAIFGGELWSKMEYIDRQVSTEELDEANLWWNWELREIVHFKAAMRDVLHDLLVCGISTPVPSYHHETRFLHSQKTWAYDAEQPLALLIQAGIEEIVNEKSEWGTDKPVEITKQSSPGAFNLSDGGRIVFSLDLDALRLRADIWRREVVFDGARVNYVSLENLVVANTDPDIEKLPGLGIRCWYSLHEYRQGLEDGFFLDHGAEENARIIATADQKRGQYISQEQTDSSDAERGTDSTDAAGTGPTHKYLEVYRREFWWVWDSSGEEYGYDKILQPATQICAWVAPNANALLKIERLEDLNKDGKRSAVKFGFIHEPGRFYDMGLAEWVRHIQTILDAIDNQRLDAGLLTNVPWGLYKPLGGQKAPIRIEPGMLYPSANPQDVNIPRWNYSPVFSMQEESLQYHYGLQQAGLGEAALGRPNTKRQSATEFITIANALDIRTEDILERQLESLKELATRVKSLYQQFGSEERIFRVAGEGGTQITKRFERDRLSGKMLLTMCGSLEFVNQEMQRKLALDMFSLLMNQILIQSQVVGPDTIYSAIKLIAKLHNYNDVPLHKPKLPPISDAPEVEEKQMFASQKPIGPTMGEDTDEHLQHHAMLAADAKLMAAWTPQARQLLEQHIQATIQMHQAQQVVAQQRAAMATQAAMSMQQQGIRPGQPGGQRPGENTGPGNAREGVQGQGAQPGVTAASPAAGQA